jgi:glucoamylase
MPQLALYFPLLTPTSFDLWEEIGSSSFWTTAVQHRALREGIALAEDLGQMDVIPGYVDQANNLLCFQQVCISDAIL